MPPRMTTRWGLSRDNSFFTAAGNPFDGVSSTGPPSSPAAAAPASASGKSIPFATYATGTPADGNAAFDTDTAVS